MKGKIKGKIKKKKKMDPNNQTVQTPLPIIPPPKPSFPVKWIIAGLVVVLVAVGVVILTQKKLMPANIPAASPSPTTVATPFPPIPVTTVIKVTDQGFDPVKTTISAGQVIKWINQSKITHEIAFDNKSPGSKAPPLPLTIPIKPGLEANFLFNEPTTYNYYDKLNPKLRGEVTVK